MDPVPGRPRCQELSEAFCEQSACLAVVSSDDVYRGCIYPTTCDDAVTCGQSPEGKQVDFPNTCLPLTWETCEAAAEVECEENQDCTVCEYPIQLNPNDAEPACPCSPGCDSYPMSRSACEAIILSWRPTNCDFICGGGGCIGLRPVSICETGQLHQTGARLTRNQRSWRTLFLVHCEHQDLTTG